MKGKVSRFYHTCEFQFAKVALIALLGLWTMEGRIHC